MEKAGERPKAHTLRQAASVVFALTAVLPLLIFAYTLHRLDALSRPQAQIGLGLALVVALLGFHIFRVMVARMAGLLRVVGRAGEQGEVDGEAPSVDLQIPGIGRIEEFGDLARSFDHLRTVWKTEAEAHLGRKVLVSVRNSPNPIAGTLVQATDDGVLLDQGAQEVGVSYRRISAIEEAS